MLICTRTLGFLQVASLLAAAAMATTASAAPVSLSFSATVAAGPYAGQVATGNFSYESTALTNVGVEVLTPAQSFSLSMNFLGYAFTEANDEGAPVFPSLTFLNGIPVSVDYFLTDGIAGVDFSEPDILGINVVGNLTPGQNVRFSAPIVVVLRSQNVPEPAGLALLGAALLGLALRRQGGAAATEHKQQ